MDCHQILSIITGTRFLNLLYVSGMSVIFIIIWGYYWIKNVFATAFHNNPVALNESKNIKVLMLIGHC